jgi:hypothetical protein
VSVYTFSITAKPFCFMASFAAIRDACGIGVGF